MVRIPLGLSIKGGLTLGQLVRRIAMCSSTAAAGQASLEFLNDESLLDARLQEVEGQIVVERRAPARPRQLDLGRSRRRGGLDPLLLRAAADHDELREEILQAATASAAGLQRVGVAMNTRSADDLSDAFREIELDLEVDTVPMRQFIAAKQGAFNLEVGDADPVVFDPLPARTRTTTSYLVGLSISTGRRESVSQFSALVLERRPMDGLEVAELPTQLFPLGRGCTFRASDLEDWQLAVLAAANALGLVIETAARHSVSTSNLESRGGEIERIQNWDELWATILRLLMSAPPASVARANAA